MTGQPSLHLTFRVKRQWRAFLITTLIGIVLYQVMTLQREDGGEFAPLTRGNVLHYLKMLFGYYYLFELISVFIFVRLAMLYVRLTQPGPLVLSGRSVIGYELKFFPFICLAIPVFGPVTNTLRYLAIFYPDYAWSDWFPEYVFTGRMFANYFLPFLVFGYGFLNLNLFLDYNDWQKQRMAAPVEPEASPIAEVAQPKPEPAYLAQLEASDEEGETLLAVRDILYVEVEQKLYYAYTLGRTYAIRKTLTELEAELNPEQFYRINRSVIANVRFVKNYSYWENDKYIVRLTDNKTEFIMQRTRLKGLKERLGTV
ncbi:LytTR family DNA-binding domain-containing protein [Arsenicibacter rosenii]|uniref:HTH LytTR-type domain-containing protein n=1 Tax=Arsenicibacter rosenii TaxID=1750698 RepID=A0A1S2VKN2_9BACT|nr:LytTR family DNA-binding domain-containing protein [Arsenicibacter rosenii]OIN58960.1 hypothetical protein BLX24_12135 [Arsenicibacter rosenii]